MKFFVAIALLAAAASAFVLPANVHLTPNELAEIEEIVAAIHSPSTDPTTAAMLEQMLYDLLGVSLVQSPVVLPALIDKPQTPVLLPALVDKPQTPVQIPAIIDEYENPQILPELVDFPLPVESVPASPVAPSASSPLVQIVVNVNQDGIPAANPVQVDHFIPERPTPVQVDESEYFPMPVRPTPVPAGNKPVRPTPVHVVDDDVIPTPVHVVDSETVVIGHLPEAVAVAPIVVAPAVVGPEILN